MNKKTFKNIFFIFGFMLLVALPAISLAETVTVSLGEEFTLKKDDIAQVKDKNVTLKLTGFSNSPCPKDAMCVWSGLAVHTEITIDGKVPGSLRESPYDVEEIKTDYTTYATLKITRADEKCTTKGDGCWDEMVRRFKDPIYCDKMQDPVGKGYCLDYLAKELGDKK